MEFHFGHLSKCFFTNYFKKRALEFIEEIELLKKIDGEIYFSHQF